MQCKAAILKLKPNWRSIPLPQKHSMNGEDIDKNNKKISTTWSMPRTLQLINRHDLTVRETNKGTINEREAEKTVS